MGNASLIITREEAYRITQLARRENEEIQEAIKDGRKIINKHLDKINSRIYHTSQRGDYGVYYIVPQSSIVTEEGVERISEVLLNSIREAGYSTQLQKYHSLNSKGQSQDCIHITWNRKENSDDN